MKKNIKLVAATSLALLFSAGSWAGPVILGGDDLTDHGSRSVGGANLEGWLYIEKAIANLYSAQTRPGTFTVDIVALGSANPGAGVYTGGAGGAINSVANVLGRSLSFYDGAADINTFFANLASGTVNPAIIWLAGTGAGNDLVITEGDALTSNATAIDTFVGSGGGLMAHGSGSIAYGWLSALLPGLTETSGCNSNGATLTAAGQAAFPGLSNSDINSNAGPCHSNFTGNFGGLTTLAFDGQNRSYIIGASGVGGGSITQPPPGIPEPASLALMGLGLAGLAAARRRKQAA